MASVRASDARAQGAPVAALPVPPRTRQRAVCAAAIAVAGALWLLGAAPAAQASFGLKELQFSFTGSGGEPSMQAGSHPFANTTFFAVDTKGSPEVPDGEAKDVIAALPAGLAGNANPGTRCPYAYLAELKCPASSAIGIAQIVIEPGDVRPAGIYNLTPPPGAAARFGFDVLSVPITVNVGVSPDPPYNLIASSTNILSQVVSFYSAKLTLWGVPADPAHNPERGEGNGSEGESFGHPAGTAEKPFLTLPTRCEGPLRTTFKANSWEQPSTDPYPFEQTIETKDDSEPPAPLGPTGCAKLVFAPKIAAAPTSRAASSPSGLDFNLDVADEGLANPKGLADSDVKRAEVTLPAGMTVNPSQAEGLGTCSVAQLGAERPDSGPGEGCPEDAKIGTVEVQTPLLEGVTLKGSLYVATPYENRAGNSLIALYMVIKDPTLGILLRLPGKVAPDPRSGQLISTFEDLPQQPFSHFHLHFREGGRSPLATPPGCGAFTTKAVFTPWANPAGPYETSAAFTIDSGPGGGPCPQGPAPFHPGFEAGTLNNAAGAYSPFDMRITRQDGEQDITKFSSVLPPGVVARLVGTSWCPESGIARAKSRTGENGGTDELGDPSCPAASKIGTTTAGAGVGSQLTYVGGSLYLAGPYNGAPLSVVSITPAVAGPFDAGTVVVREALTLNSVTGVAEVDGAASDPIPHILQGIPLNVRELRVHVDKPDFTLNATSCAELQAKATLWGGGTVLAPTPDSPVDLAARYQAADCASLGFEPRLAIRLYGGTRRGAHPALRAIVRPDPGEANFSRAAVTLPHSAFLDQGHIRTICTRVQFAAGAGHGSQCPKGAVYGSAKAWSPLLDAPATGPVYLRSSNHNLPDLVVALKGPDSAPVDVELASRIDSVRGGIRSIFTGIPDVPVSRFVLAMQGGKKGLIVNSRNLCYKPKRNKARANLLGQNGRKQLTKPRVVSVKCAKRRKAKRKAKRRHNKRAAAKRASVSRGQLAARAGSRR